MSEAEDIARFIAEHGVTTCPPGYADVPTQAADPLAKGPAAQPGRRWRSTSALPYTEGRRRLRRLTIRGAL